jgi:hypothetical protein
MNSLIEKTTDYVGRYISYYSYSRPEYDELAEEEEIENQLSGSKDGRISSWYNHESEPLLHEPEDIVSAVLGSKIDKIIKVVFFIYSLGSSMAYFVVIIDQGKAFFDFNPSLAPLLCLLPFPFSFAENVAFLKHTGPV